MADDRPLEDPAEQASRLEQRIADLEAVYIANRHRRPTGTVENTFRTTPQEGTLFCQGQTVSRTDYPDLWQFAQDQGLVLGGLAFGTGDGSTTFVLPDTRGRVLVGAGSLGTDTYAIGTAGGTARVTLAIAQMPTHDHNVAVNTHAAHDHTFAGSGTAGSGGSHSHGGSVGSAGSHAHGFTTSSAGAHGGHVGGGGSPNADGAAQSNYTTSLGAHTHSGGTDSQGSHTHSITTDTEAAHTHSVSLTGDVGSAAAMGHTVNESPVGSGAQVDARMPFAPINVLVWV